MNQQSKETTRALEKETKATSEYNKQLAIFNESASELDLK